MIYLHVDIDNLWMYEKEFGIQIHRDKELIYSHSLPLFLKLLKKTNSKATFMIIGQDLKLPACALFCKKALKEGHEIANHTWSHPVFFGKMSQEEKRSEITRAHCEITKVCGRPPVGFRGAGYYQDNEIISILQRLGYKYDSSVLPGFASFLMESYALLKGRENKRKTFGAKSYFLKKDKPYIIKTSYHKNRLLELPISILPLVRLPIHTTFAYFFGSPYRDLVLRYLNSKPTYMLYLFHAIDFVNLGKTYRNHPVIPLRYSFSERMNFVESVLKSLVTINKTGLQTAENTITSIRRLYQ